MGCSQTKIMCYTRSTNTEKEQRSKKRQQFMQDAVLAVNKFAAAHSSYANCLSKTGAALTDFAAQFPATFMEPFVEKEVEEVISMKEESIVEEEEEDGEEENIPQLQQGGCCSCTKEEVIPMKKESTVEDEEEENGEEENMPKEEESRVKGKLSIVEVKESTSVVEDLGDHFVKASKAAEEVSRLLEGTGLHCHSKFTHINMRGHVPDETFAMILNKLLAMENKFCQELKNAESKKLEYERKFTELNKLFERGTKGEAVEKLKVVVNHLHTGCTLYEQSLESTVSEINNLCDQQLYPALVHLVDKMATMWKIMETHHEQQLKIAMLLIHVDSFQSPIEATRHNHEKTRQLLLVLQEWLSQFDLLINNQKKCIMALNNLLEMRDEISESLPIQVLLQAWHGRLEKLPQQYVRTTIANFAAEIDSILQEQDKEMVLKRKWEVKKNEYAVKSRQLTEWEKKYEEKKKLEVLGPHMVDHPHEIVREKGFSVQLMKMRLDAAKEDYTRQCLHVTQKSLGGLQTHLPKLFKAMSDFSLKSSTMYSELADL